MCGGRACSGEGARGGRGGVEGDAAAGVGGVDEDAAEDAAVEAITLFRQGAQLGRCTLLRHREQLLYIYVCGGDNRSLSSRRSAWSCFKDSHALV